MSKKINSSSKKVEKDKIIEHKNVINIVMIRKDKK
jgi:hypothetical protein